MLWGHSLPWYVHNTKHSKRHHESPCVVWHPRRTPHRRIYPRDIRPDVILKISRSAMFGSDLHLHHGEIAALQKGDILGHEFMGMVDKIGPNFNNLQVSQRIVALFQKYCLRSMQVLQAEVIVKVL
ncbi:hypothetical protein A0H81_00943 [Grifola frondosa]|uniref:Alcohol dehydrogenase-like N-terminal domain-containing protein n=1 Tax=Grifola frondosa TaxID=5627 RepID=A0A1C7MQW2_GRIFR|nr:hypothetical protein A0H81_00943 [Grifola frondosa]